MRRNMLGCLQTDHYPFYDHLVPLAGIGGVAEGLGIYSNVHVQTSSMSVGFNGMAVALLAMNSPIGIPFAFLFEGLQIGGELGSQL